MKDKITDALNEIDDDLILEADNFRQKKKPVVWKKYAAIAAAFAAILMAAVIVLQFSEKTEPVSIGGISRPYGNVSIGAAEEAIVWPWDYLTVSEKYTAVLWEGTEYTIRSTIIPVDEQALEASVGTCEAMGYDEYTEQIYRENFTVYPIAGIAVEKMVAVQMENAYYVFSRNDYDPPKTFGEILDTYSLPDHLHFERFRLYQNGREKGIYRISDDAAVWQILSQCREVPFIAQENWTDISDDYISFTATSDTLGVYKRVFYVYANGYVKTNVFDYGYVFCIGEEAANQIISYARKNGKEVPDEPYTASLAGTITEIGEDYILLDDSILCKDPEDGMVFRIPAEDLRIRRALEVRNIQPGYIVVVYFTGDIDTNADNLVTGAYELSPAFLYDGMVSVTE